MGPLLTFQSRMNFLSLPFYLSCACSVSAPLPSCLWLSPDPSTLLLRLSELANKLGPTKIVDAKHKPPHLHILLLISGTIKQAPGDKKGLYLFILTIMNLSRNDRAGKSKRS